MTPTQPDRQDRLEATLENVITLLERFETDIRADIKALGDKVDQYNLKLEQETKRWEEMFSSGTTNCGLISKTIIVSIANVAILWPLMQFIVRVLEKIVSGSSPQP
jgi:hypothetical protein